MPDDPLSPPTRPTPPVTILLFRGTSILDDGIEWFTRGAYSHAAMLLADGRQIEALAGGVTLDTSLVDHGLVYEKYTTLTQYPDGSTGQPTDQQLQAVINFAMDQIGKPYDYEGFIDFITRAQPTDLGKAFFCSSLVFASFQAGGINLLRDTKPYEVSPSMMAKSPLLVGPI